MEENKVAWLIMALDSNVPQDPTKFLDMMDRIHMDEKNPKRCVKSKLHIAKVLFDMMDHIHVDEKNPKRCIKSKSNIPKVMFLCAVAHPHFNPSENSWWDGKLGIWPIGDWEPAKRASKN